MQSFDIDSINLKWNRSYPAVVFELEEFSLDGFTRIWQPVYLSANRHFGYAIQWLGLSLVALAGFIFVGFRKND
jgi:cytochrome oxidase assembly protein ShyY1